MAMNLAMSDTGIIHHAVSLPTADYVFMCVCETVSVRMHVCMPCVCMYLLGLY